MALLKILFFLTASIVLVYAQVDYSILNRPNMRIVQNVSVFNSMDEEVVMMAVNLTIWGDYDPARDSILVSNFMSDKFAYIMSHPEEVFGMSNSTTNSSEGEGSGQQTPLVGSLRASEGLFVGRAQTGSSDTSSSEVPNLALQLSIDIMSHEPSSENITFLEHVRAML